MTSATSQPAFNASRRQGLRGLVASAAWLGLGPAALLGTGTVAAQTAWPSKPIRLVVAFPPGGLADIMARAMQQGMQETFGQPIVIDNRGGAGGNVAASEVVKNGGDQHTFLITVSTTESVNPVMFPSMPFDPARDLQPVALVANSQLFLVTRANLPPNNLREFVAHLKANPGKLAYGSAGNGTTPHLAGELFKQSAGVFATHIPYRGAAPVIADLLANQIDFGFMPGTVYPHVRSGKLKMHAIASPKRVATAADTPTFDEMGWKDVHADTLFGMYAPTAMPADMVARMHREVQRQLALPAIKARWLEMGAEAVPMSTADFKSMVQRESQLFRRIVSQRGIKSE